MKNSIGFAIIVLLLMGCKDQPKATKTAATKATFNQELADELKKMTVVDQLAAWNAYPPETHQHLSLEEWNAFKDSVYRTHQKRLQEIFNEFGFAGYDLVGEEGSLNFWLMTQHSDHNPDFQQQILEKMKIEVDKGNASSSNYALLVDRVQLNTGKPQIYGTQVDYNFDIAQAFPKNLADSTKVNERRKSVGLEPIEQYLNDMSRSNFEMNKQLYLDKGITEPTLYKIE
ncbi:DUF6624 domain-containing protein [Spongiimicrobium salis]|uniref:DUF6624 domain-containing protein n=1 Tax=Spongiimicrobium salis TaxID=1667022 RepID=UPI00374CFE5B